MLQVDSDVQSMAEALELDENGIRLRKEFLSFGPSDAALLKEIQSALGLDAKQIIDAFYDHLQEFQEPQDVLFARRNELGQLKQQQLEYVRQLAGGKYGRDYALSCARVGAVHHHLGLKPQWHIGAYGNYLNSLLPQVAQYCAGDMDKFQAASSAFIKLALLDLQIFVDAYFHAEQEILRLLAQVFESNMEAVMIADHDGTILHANNTVQAVTGFAPAELLGKPLTVLQADAGQQWETMMQVAEGSGQWQGEVMLKNSDGTEFPAWMNVGPVKDKHGKATHFVAEFSNISAFREAQDALAQRTEELARSNRELEQFAYVASHDLQEPLRMVASYTQLLARRYKDKLDDDANEFIGYAVDGATRMQALITDLLALSRIGTRGKPLEDCETGAALERALANLRLSVAESGTTVTFDAMPKLKADVSQLTQLFQNLIGNAVKFRGKEAPHVHVGAEQQEGKWQFSVRDNGIGIKPEFFERIFVIFQRLHSKEEYPGTGIGLAVCKKIVERHGGQIWIESEPGQGTTFFFTIAA